MVRIRIKINVHDGTSQKGKLIDCISEVEAVVFKIIEGREAFFLLTDTANMEKLLKEDASQKFARFILYQLSLVQYELPT